MFKPIGDHVLVDPQKFEEITKSGIVLPDSAKEKPQQGVIVAVGSGKYYDDELVSFADMGLKVGDMIMFAKYGPTEIELDGKEYFILESHDILGVLETKIEKKKTK